MATTWLKVADVITLLGVSRDTWDKWRAKGAGYTPPARRLPNGELRIDERDLEAWMDDLLVTK